MGARDGGLSSSAVTVLVASLFFCCDPTTEIFMARGQRGKGRGRQNSTEVGRNDDDDDCSTSTFSIHHPLDALVLFFRMYAGVDWSQYCVTLCGPMPLRKMETVSNRESRDGKGDCGRSPHIMEALGLVANSSLRDYQVRLAKDMVYRALGGTKHAQKVADALGSTHAAQFGLSMRRSWNVIDPWSA